MTLAGCLQDRSPWLQVEDTAFALAYSAGGIEAASRALPGRSVAALYHRARHLQLHRRRRWTAADDRSLRGLWEDGYALRSIAARLGRTVATTYWRAQLLELPLGVPSGYEYLSAAAERTGYSTAQLRSILSWAGVKVRRTLSRPTGAPARAHFVDPLDVDDAVAAWLQTETAEAAARRLGISGDRLRARLRRIGVSTGRQRHARITPEELARANEIAIWTRAHARSAVEG